MRVSKNYLLLILLLISTASLNAKVFLVSVGVSDYPGTKMDLSLPARDAETITELYSKNTELRYCQLLNENATKAKILTAMHKVFLDAKENDVVVFFFSGHGYEGGFCAYDDYLSYKEIRKAMSKSKCKNKMIFADACFSGQLRTDKPTSQSDINASKNANVMLFLSSRSNEVSMENKMMKNGFFTTYLQKGLKGEADKNNDRIISAGELFLYVHAGVKEISEDKQHPVMWGKFPNDMPVMIWK